MAKKKKRLKKVDLSKHDPLSPLEVDFNVIGSNMDPCFGKGYDLSTKECKQCGDSELCAFRVAQVLGKTRKELEDKNHYKDLDVLEDVDGMKKFMRKLKRSGMSRREIVKKTSLKFEVPTSDVRQIYRTLK